MSMNFDKVSSLARAKELLSQNDDTLLRYVCLDLRYCLEDITYNKLRLYAKRLPLEVLEKWQPPQALRALLEYEPYADQNFTLRVCIETEPGVPSGNWTTLGTHRSFKLSWLRKTYNKLGNFLHIPSIKNQCGDAISQEPNPLRKSLNEIIVDLDQIVASPLDSTLASVISFQCSVCNDYVLINRDSVRKTKRAVCLNQNCSSEFFATEDEEGNFNFQLMASLFKCLSCEHLNQIENRKLDIGYRFKCDNCGEEHEFAQRQWGYGKVKDIYKSS